MKHRSSFVSNSSSSSFILNSPDDIKYFKSHSFRESHNIYLTNDIKALIVNFIKDFTSSYNINDPIHFDDVYDKYFSSKVPDYFKYYHINDWDICNWNFSNLKLLVDSLPDNKWITDSYDRDWAFEYIPSFIKEFDGDL